MRTHALLGLEAEACALTSDFVSGATVEPDERRLLARAESTAAGWASWRRGSGTRWVRVVRSRLGEQTGLGGREGGVVGRTARVGPVGAAPLAEGANAAHDAATDAASGIADVCRGVEEVVAHLADACGCVRLRSGIRSRWVLEGSIGGLACIETDRREVLGSCACICKQAIRQGDGRGTTLGGRSGVEQRRLKVFECGGRENMD